MTPEEREAAVVESVARAIEASIDSRQFNDWEWQQALDSGEISRIRAVAAVAAYRATQPRVDVLLDGELRHTLTVTLGDVGDRAARDGGAEELRDALRVHHPIMRSETGPFSGCRCGQVKLGQDVIGHVTDHLRAALAPQAGPDCGQHVGSCRIFYAERRCTCIGQSR